MSWTEVYVAFGGNIGDTASLFRLAIKHLEGIKEIQGIEVSPFYETTPVGNLFQNLYLNAVCRFETILTAKELLKHLQCIESALGKIPKPKEAARPIDLDILFYGKEFYHEPELEVPHPRWSERLFVLRPLADLVDHLYVPLENGMTSLIDLKAMLDNFSNPNNEVVRLII